MVLRRATLVGAVAALALIGEEDTAVAPTPATASPTLVAGGLDLRAVIRVTSASLAACPRDSASGAVECRERRGTSGVPGLGTVSETYVWSYGAGSPPCPSDLVVKPLATTGRMVVSGKGELRFAIAEGAKCVDVEPVRNEPQTFTITGGTGAYQGASGSGTVTRSLAAGVGTETWTGRLVAPGIEFDVTRPTLSGATSRTVRAPKGAKSARVAYRVTASDTADGQVGVACTPRSGTRFPVGRTSVSCSATDSSANTANASFRITVRRTS
jgi:HYR domain-containing protein